MINNKGKSKCSLCISNGTKFFEPNFPNVYKWQVPLYCQSDFFGRILYIRTGLCLERLLIAKPTGHTVYTANICQL